MSYQQPMAAAAVYSSCKVLMFPKQVPNMEGGKRLSEEEVGRGEGAERRGWRLEKEEIERYTHCCRRAPLSSICSKPCPCLVRRVGATGSRFCPSPSMQQHGIQRTRSFTEGREGKSHACPARVTEAGDERRVSARLAHAPHPTTTEHTGHTGRSLPFHAGCSHACQG